MSYLLDTDWSIRVIAGDGDAIEPLRSLAGARMAISWVTLAELHDGVYRAINPSARLARIQQFTHRYPILYPTAEIAVEFAALRAILRRQGNLIADFDLLIAATALLHDLTLLTFNRRHFERIHDLRVYSAT